ncbi:hypothetical protein ACIMS1_004424 [Vibrio harveyi]
MKSISKYFEQDLFAPMKNSQWSWGSENKVGVYLKVWEEDIHGDITHLGHKKVCNSRLGHFERLQHIKHIQQGKPGYIIILRMKAGSSKRIKSYSEYLYPIRDIYLDKDDSFYGVVNYDNPQSPSCLNRIIDYDSVLDIISDNPIARDCFIKATEKFGWQPVKLEGSIIFLISRDGRQQSKINIKTGIYQRF